MTACLEEQSLSLVENGKMIKLTMLIKEMKVRSLVSGDRQVRLTLESLYAEDVPRLLTELSDLMEVEVEIKKPTKVAFQNEPQYISPKSQSQYLDIEE